MNIRKKIWLTFAGIIILTVLAGVVDYPKGPDIAIKDYNKELKVHLGLDLQGGTHLVYEADTSQIIEEDRVEALEGVRDVIERRVNAFGVSEPLVQTNKSGEAWRVIVELPGVTDVNEAIQMIGETPLLEFKEEGEPPELTEEEKAAIQVYNEDAKSRVEEILQQALDPNIDFAELAKEKSEGPSAENGGDLDFFGRGVMDVAFEEAAFAGAVGEVYPELVQSQFGYHVIKVTDKKTEANEEGEEEEQVRASHILVRTQSEEPSESMFPNFVNTGLSGQQLERAEVAFNPNTGIPEVSLEFDDEGKQLFGEITERNVGKLVAIYLDGSPISIPRVNEPIKEGRAVISGEFTINEAKELARRLNAGALPVPITLMSQQNIGPTLGEVSVQKSIFAGLLGLVIVMLFMIIYYRLPGVLSAIALVMYSLIVLAIFKLWPVVLTLAGVAGFILSVGMAIDANVLIFERVREELRSGKPLLSAVEDGFKRAWLSIRDSNVSSLITCIILAWFGTSLIRGFAITLAVGILVSMFSAITITRTFLRLMVSKRLENKLGWFGVKKRSD